MIKESKYRVNPNALSCLLHLRLKTEAGVRASHTTAEKQPNKNKGEEKRGKGTAAVKNHLSKKARKVLKEKESIRKEMKAAEVEVNKEERNNIVWGTPANFPCAEVFSLAHRNLETRLRSLLPNSQEPVPNTASSRRTTRNREILAFGQR
jgi:hypothetical protein